MAPADSSYRLPGVITGGEPGREKAKILAGS
jgi:hypothetical protein